MKDINVLRSLLAEEMKSEEVIETLKLLHPHYSKLSGPKAAAFATAVLSTVLGVTQDAFERIFLTAVISELAIATTNAIVKTVADNLAETIDKNLNKTTFAKTAPTRGGQNTAVLAREYADTPWVQVDALATPADADKLVEMMNTDDYVRRAYLASLTVDEDWGDNTAVQEG